MAFDDDESSTAKARQRPENTKDVPAGREDVRGSGRPAERNLVRQRVFDPEELHRRLISGVGKSAKERLSMTEQIATIQAFVSQNSPPLRNIPLRRLFPVIIYLPHVESGNHIVGDFEVEGVEAELFNAGFVDTIAFPPTYGGSAIITVFGVSEKESIFKNFWQDHPGLDVATTLLHRVGGVGGVVALIGLMYFGPSGKPKSVSIEDVKHVIAAAAQPTDARAGRDALVRRLEQRPPKKHPTHKKKHVQQM